MNLSYEKEFAEQVRQRSKKRLRRMQSQIGSDIEKLEPVPKFIAMLILAAAATGLFMIIGRIR